MNKDDALDILILLSSLETYLFAFQKEVPDHLQDQMLHCTRVLQQLVLDEKRTDYL